MNDDALRALVRETIARHLATAPPPAAGAPPWKSHASHARFALPTGGDPQNPCLIEPDVRCTACGYCKSYGH
jgi:hypothetical protein